MNHLAHFFLAGKDDDLRIGNFVADFISNRQQKEFSEAVWQGVLQHRAIDDYTDYHPEVKASTTLLHPTHHKYSPVIVDILYDYFLIKNWSFFEKEITLRDYTHQLYQLLTERQNELPQPLRQRIDLMIADDWLLLYGNYEGLDRAFARLEHRATFEGNFSLATRTLRQFEQELEAHFLAFFPQLLAFISTYKNEITQ